MKKIIWILLLLTGAVACNNNGNRSDAYGNFEATEVMVSALAQGELLSLDLEEGDRLEKGQIVGLVDTTDLWLKKEQLLKSIAAVQTRLVTIKAQMDVQQQQKKNLLVDKGRLENLFNDGAATQKQMDDINGAIDLVDAQITATRSQQQQVEAEIQTIYIQIDQVREAIDRCFVTNPVAGTVLVKYAEAGEVATPAKPLYKIADLRTMKLKIYVSGYQLPHIKIGQNVEVQFDKTKKENTSLDGTVSWISSTSEFTPKTIQTKDERVNLVYAVKVAVPNDGSIKIGMPGEVNFK
ncbi:MAG: HlyD family efflux transporter periplasmic adaptor subunit [Bacteroidales bacterium]|jgi:HlyD family secretion protein|nr:HlyD family efflux transporter periplasmic adaptor subunit [Bacteroidales bacterium]